MMIAFNDDVSYRYPRTSGDALHGIEMTLGEGIHLLLGENGAGKTTLLHLIASLLTPSTGRVEIDGVDAALRHPSTLRRIFFLGADDRMPADTINALARLHARPFYPRFDSDILTANLRAFEINPHTPLAAMSLGQRKKAMAAYALALRPEILLLDEPANGFDIGSRDTLRALMAQCVEPEQMVIVSTHTTADLQPLFDSIIMLSHGKLLFAKSTAEITSRLAFIIDNIPPRDAIFTLNDIGRFRSIAAATTDTEDATELDIHLLYSALHSPSATEILNILNTSYAE